MKGLISADDLQARLGEHGLVVLDTRSGGAAAVAAFEAAHIPGARHTDYAGDGWRERRGNAPGLLPGPAHLRALFSRLGLGPAQDIVVVPAGAGVSELAAAARILWTLKVMGHPSVALLDGGMAGWLAEGRPIEAGDPALAPAAPGEHAPDATVRAEAQDVLDALGRGAALVDARAPSFFAGYDKAAEALRPGHIPGALNLDYVLAYDAARQRLRPRGELDALFADVPQGPVISYCNTGHTAALNWFVLSEVLGRPDVRLYDGSMTDWTQDPARPVTSLF